MSGARWVQTELLERYPRANVRVHAIWFRMYPGDSKASWPRDIMADPRVQHFWDEERVVGSTYFEDLARLAGRRAPKTTETEGEILWDAYLLYPAGARWEGGRTNVMSWGRTILMTRETLQRDFARYAAGSAQD